MGGSQREAVDLAINEKSAAGGIRGKKLEAIPGDDAGKPEEAVNVAKTFHDALQLTGLILTKLDEAAGMGSLLTAARKLPLPVSYLTTGQDVPDDMECANASRMARLVLGQEKIET